MRTALGLMVVVAMSVSCGTSQKGDDAGVAGADAGPERRDAGFYLLLQEPCASCVALARARAPAGAVDCSHRPDGGFYEGVDRDACIAAAEDAGMFWSYGETIISNTDSYFVQFYFRDDAGLRMQEHYVPWTIPRCYDEIHESVCSNASLPTGTCTAVSTTTVCRQVDHATDGGWRPIAELTCETTGAACDIADGGIGASPPTYRPVTCFKDESLRYLRCEQR